MVKSALLVAATLVTMGCNGPETAKTPTPTKSSSSTAPTTAPSMSPDERRALAAAGYFTSEEGARAWAEHKKRGGFLDGSELVGTTPPDWQLSDWVNGPAKSLAELRGQVVVVRFWTSPDCPFCAKTMPALQKLANELADQPLVVIGAYHAKPASSVPDMTAPAELATRWKVRFPLAFDREWNTLRSWWLGSAPRLATSVTFVIGKDGKIAFVHPGPVFHPSTDPDEAKQNGDYQAVRQAIVTALAK